MLLAHVLHCEQGVEQGFSKWGPGTSNCSISWELVTHANFLGHLRNIKSEFLWVGHSNMFHMLSRCV